MVLPEAQRTHKISIVPRGMAALGLTWQRPTEDRYLLLFSSDLFGRYAWPAGAPAPRAVATWPACPAACAP